MMEVEVGLRGQSQTTHSSPELCNGAHALPPLFFFFFNPNPYGPHQQPKPLPMFKAWGDVYKHLNSLPCFSSDTHGGSD
jgi:hypothetical protein